MSLIFIAIFCIVFSSLIKLIVNVCHFSGSFVVTVLLKWVNIKFISLFLYRKLQDLQEVECQSCMILQQWPVAGNAENVHPFSPKNLKTSWQVATFFLGSGGEVVAVLLYILCTG